MKPGKILTGNFKVFSYENFKNDLKQVDQTLKYELSNVNRSFENFFNRINQTLDKHVPYLSLSQKRQKTAGKHWITKGILTSVKTKNNIYNEF